MDHRDVWFVGLLALAYLVLDASSGAGRRQGSARPSAASAPAGDGAARSLRTAIRDACPRDLTHRISLRGDGAMWCRACDEGFYPAGMVLA